MQLRHEFTMPVPVDEAWRTLLDIERVAPCVPGATIEDFDGTSVAGRVRVEVGRIGLTYGGTAVFEDQDDTAHRLVLTAGGKELRGRGTARATVTGTLTEAVDGGTVVSVRTDLTVTGRPARFGHEVLAEAGDKLIGQFADCLSRQLTEAHELGAAAHGPAGTAGGTYRYDSGSGHLRLAPPLPEAEPIELLRPLVVPLAKRVGAVLLGAVAGVAAVVVWRRGRCPWSTLRHG
ncbi:SRPBCC family protein [Streptomyces sp. NPDC091292]|uniref:SRPBCC family protein n=1 Tax=Streptomyces sp. NPDC091292 TaxID=3365991 RepID=UPI0038182107